MRSKDGLWRLLGLTTFRLSNSFPFCRTQAIAGFTVDIPRFFIPSRKPFRNALWAKICY